MMMAPQSGRDLRRLLQELLALDHVRGGLVVALDGLVIVAEIPPDIAVEPLSALAATLGRELEVAAPRLGPSRFRLATFSSERGTCFIGGTSIGFFLVLAAPEANHDAVRAAMRSVIDRVQTSWTREPSTSA